MPSTTHFVVVPFLTNPEGEPFEAQTPSGASFRAKAAALNAGGAIAFSRSGDARFGEYQEGVLLTREGVTPDGLAAYVGA